MFNEILPVLLLALLGLFLRTTINWFLSRSNVVKELPGPGAASWLVGHMPTLMRPEASGDTDFAWTRLFGPAVHFKGPFGRDVLFTSDPKAIQHILNTPRYRFPKSSDMRFRILLVAGRGLAWADGEQHARQRKVMGPAFSQHSIKTFLPHIRDTSRKVTAKWQNMFLQSADGPLVLDVHSWLSRLALDSLGGALDYDFEALSNKSHNELTSAYKNLLTTAHYKPSNFSFAFREICGYLPQCMISVIQSIPSNKSKLLVEYTKTAERVSRTLIDRQLVLMAAGEDGGKDIMSLLVKANQVQDSNAKVEYSELVSQLTTFIVAGHETIGNTVGWILYELSKHPALQTQLRSELESVQQEAANQGRQVLETSDYDSMTLLTATIKETLRFHPALPLITRVANQDDVLPLFQPTRTTSNKIIHEIPVQKGQRITISIAAYHRLSSVWGNDANAWNPKRFLTRGANFPVSDTIALGVTSNLLTFSSGERSCIGWRFAMLSMQVILSEIIEKYEFAPPPENIEVFRAAAAVITPMVKGSSIPTAELPLTVKPVSL